MDPVNDYLVWYSKSPRESGKVKFRPLFQKRGFDTETLRRFNRVELPSGQDFPITAVPSPKDTNELIDYRARPLQLFKDWPHARLFYPGEQLTSGGERPNQSDPVEFQGQTFRLKPGLCWKTTTRTADGSPSGMDRLKAANRLAPGDGHLNYKRYLDDFGYMQVSNWWDGLGGAPDPIFVVQTNPEIIQRCILMTTDPGELVFDPTCGSGTTAYVAEQWGRRWITCDTSRVALALAKQRLMTATFDYYELARPDEGVSSGFSYETVPHITLKSIANNPEISEGMTRAQIDAAIKKYADRETLYDRPKPDRTKTRVTGPFTIEAVPAPAVRPLDEIEENGDALPADESVARTGETQRQGDWRDELFKTGIRGKSGQRIAFSRVEPLPGTRWLHADAEIKEATPQRVVVSFGPEHAPLEQRQVELAIEEAQQLVPKPKIIVLAAFQFDPEAAKDIDETHWPGVTLLKAQMNADLLTQDLKKKRASNESFWLIGQPDIEIEKITKGEDKGKYRISVQGFDYYNTKTGTIESGGAEKIAMWLLDPDYDGRSLFPRQVFFIADVMQDGLEKLARNLKAEIDPEKIASYSGMVSLPFAVGTHRRAAVKIIDDRGIESLKLIGLD
jgi:adenine-specific DNA-methyltransferase